MRNKKIIIKNMDRIFQILNELQYSERKQITSIQRNQRNIIRKIEKLQEYNEIDDMNNALINKKINEIMQIISM